MNKTHTCSIDEACMGFITYMKLSFQMERSF